MSLEERSLVLTRPVFERSRQLEGRVRAILEDVRQSGDPALLRLTERFDGVSIPSGGIRVTPEEIRAAYERVDSDSLSAIRESIRRVKLFHQEQVPRTIDFHVAPGVRCERRFLPIERVGLYVPGGSAPLPSIAIMLGVPAMIAGCPLRALVTPPRSDGSVEPHVLVVADLLGIERVYRVGGAPAIAALAFGTETVPRVDKIVGPGNAWVLEAQAQVAQAVRGLACDSTSGPSELMVIADASADPAIVAADLLSQAEHGADSQVILLTDSGELIDRVKSELGRQLEGLPRGAELALAFAGSALIRVAGIGEAIEIANGYAAGHLILHLRDPRSWLAAIRNAGSVFIGPWSPVSAGDYASGPNHVLPTGGAARTCGAIGVESFLKPILYQELSASGLRLVGTVVDRLAGIEGLEAHRNSVGLRLGGLQRD